MKVNLTLTLDPALSSKIDQIIALLIQSNQKDTIIMATLDQILADVTAETTDIGSLSKLIAGLEAQIKALPGLTPAQQAEIDSIFAAAEANKVALAAALVMNVPPAPPVPGVAQAPAMRAAAPIPSKS